MREAADHSFQENLADGEAIFDLMASVDNCPCPVVGRINGSAFGGGIGLVSCCDIVVAVDRAQFGFREVRLGLVPAVISPFVLAKIGQTNGRELMLTGERFGANHAQSIGLVHHVVGEDQLDEKVGERVLELLNSAPEAVARAKALIRDIAGQTTESKRQYTTNLIAELRSNPEGLEGLNAFLEKRDPSWRDSS
jgi:methylglutaconyl-CoA hydratase